MMGIYGLLITSPAIGLRDYRLHHQGDKDLSSTGQVPMQLLVMSPVVT